MSDMSIGAACAIFRNLKDEDYSDTQKMDAIWSVAGMETHNSFRREDCFEAIKFLLSHVNDLRWIPFETKYDEEEEAAILSCQLPEPDDEILVSDGKYCWIDILLEDTDEDGNIIRYLDSNIKLDGLAWLPKPNPKF